MRRAIQSVFASLSGLVRKRIPKSSEPLPLRKVDAWAADNITVLALTMDYEERRVIASAASRNQWKVLFSGTFEDAQAALGQLRVPVILCDRDLPGMAWREVVQALARLPSRPCVILMSRVVDEYLWNEIVGSGGYEVLSKPLREEDLARAVRLACSYWNSSHGRPVLPAKIG